MRLPQTILCALAEAVLPRPTASPPAGKHVGREPSLPFRAVTRKRREQSVVQLSLAATDETSGFVDEHAQPGMILFVQKTGDQLVA